MSFTTVRAVFLEIFGYIQTYINIYIYIHTYRKFHFIIYNGSLGYFKEGITNNRVYYGI